jgi:hypothetical protein
MNDRGRYRVLAQNEAFGLQCSPSWSISVPWAALAMKNDIVSKLNQHLAAGITREADVLYVLAEIRKLFEHARTAQNYPVLAFYTNWALHTKIDREPWAKAGLKTLEDALGGYQDGSRGP